MNQFRRFMMGRYGSDQLNVCLLVIDAVLIVLRSITGKNWLGFFILALLMLCTFRMFSRNISARYAENQGFLKVWAPVQSRFHNLMLRFQDRKTHRYFRCPQCKKLLRVPRGRGKINITCPQCQTQFIKKT